MDIKIDRKIGKAAVAGAISQLADKKVLMVGLGVGLLFGKKAGLKTTGAIIGIGAIHTSARYVIGDFDIKEDED